MTFPNPYPVRLPSHSTYVITFFCNSNYYQRATVTEHATVSEKEEVGVVFNGRGYKTQMMDQGGRKDISGTTRRSGMIFVLFEFSGDGITYAPATVAQTWSMPELMMVGTTDLGNDGGYATATSMNATFSPSGL